MPAWPMWRVVRAGWATMGELKTTVTRGDVLRMNDLLDAIDEAEDELNLPK